MLRKKIRSRLAAYEWMWKYILKQDTKTALNLLYITITLAAGFTVTIAVLPESDSYTLVYTYIFLCGLCAVLGYKKRRKRWG